MTTNLRNIALALFLVTTVLCAGALSANADSSKIWTKRDRLKQEKLKQSATPSERACALYLDNMDKLYKGKSVDIEIIEGRFKGLRKQYVRCTFYDPFSEPILKEMAALREEVLGSDPLQAAKAMKAYKNLVRRHLANLAVVQMALEIAREDSRFGSPEFYSDVRGFIRNSLRDKRHDGSEPSKAIEIMTMAEQDYIIASAGGELIDSELIEDDGLFYYALDFQEEGSNYKFSIFLDVTTPMTVIRRRQEEAEKQKQLNVFGSPQ
ncbi:MAG: hypothetical protein KDI90_07270 [Alphaproteobacteria bacterium]|nr:hypothetical protein [Alphaproteobacteria bacterium]MCB9974534.1 hypothetical protein [Rhodospirillales bacterium]